MTRQLKVADGRFSIILPGTWAPIPLTDDEAIASRVRALVMKQIGRNDRLARTRRELREQLTDTAIQAKANGAISFALSLEILPGIPFPASLLIAEDTWPLGDEELDFDDLAGRLRNARPNADILDFVSGPVARVAERGVMQLGESTTPKVEAQYWVAGDGGSRLFRVFVDAPMADAPELYLELFDAIVDSMIWIADDAPDAE
jgi:hypothetical protein